MPQPRRRTTALISGIASLVLLGASLALAAPASADDHEEPCYEYFDLIEYRRLVTEAQPAVPEVGEWQNVHTANRYVHKSGSPTQDFSIGQNPNLNTWTYIGPVTQSQWVVITPAMPAVPAVYEYQWVDERDPAPGDGWTTTGEIDADAVEEEVECSEEPDPCLEDPTGDGCEQVDPCLEDPTGDGCEQVDPCLEDPTGDGCDDQDGPVLGITVLPTSVVPPAPIDGPGDLTDTLPADEPSVGADVEGIAASTSGDVAVAGASTLPRTGLSTLPMFLLGLSFLTGGFSLSLLGARRNEP